MSEPLFEIQGGRLRQDEYGRGPRLAPMLSAILALSLVSQSIPASTTCADVILGPSDLEAILDTVLASWSDVVRDRSVTIVPNDAPCYVHIRITADLLPGIDCVLEACSVAVFQGQQIGVRDFDFKGCDAVFNLLPTPRHVPTSLEEARDRIDQHCHAPGFVIAQVAPITTPAGPRIRIKLRPTAR